MRTVKGEACGRPVHIEEFNSVNELLRVCRGRTKVISGSNDDYFGGDRGAGDWDGFSDPEDLWRRCRSGRPDIDLKSRVAKLIGRVDTEKVDRLCEMKRSVVGCAPVPSAVAMGMPNCMLTVKPVQVPSRIIRLTVDVDVNSCIPRSSYEAVGTAMAMAVVTLEKKGYRVDALCSASIYWRGRRSTTVIAVPMKKASTGVNYAHLAFELCDIAFFRGVVFGWMVRCPASDPQDRHLGCSLADEDQAMFDEVQELAAPGRKVMAVNEWLGQYHRLRYIMDSDAAVVALSERMLGLMLG